jgi:hypothetical protein
MFLFQDLLHCGGGSSSIESDDYAKKNTNQQDTPDPPPQPEVVDAEDPKRSQQRPGGDDDDDEASLKEKLRKPDKVLPCPRCNSMDTKFCYFNNYNVNQPRHFCKNCQRYWTAGGAMRNVPVGAGRRKNKNAASHFLHRVRAAAAGDPLETNGTVLSFGGHGGAPALLDLAEQHEMSHLKEKLLNQSVCSEGSSTRDDDKNHLMSGTKDTVPDVAVAKPATGGVQHPANMNGATTTTMWPYSCAPSQQAYYPPPGIAIYPAAPGYWACMVPGGWNLPWPAAQGGLSSPSSVSSSGRAASSLTLLGKHAREGDDEPGIRCHGSGKVWAPKTIRIDDADEVAKSSIWSLIGIKGDEQNADMDGCKHGSSTVFEPKHDEANKTAKQAMITAPGSPLLHANPVALTRSLTFQEGS